MISDREPKLFSIYPDTRNKFVKFCNHKITKCILSAEVLWSKLKANIATESYNNYLNEIGNNQTISYNDFLKLIGLKSIPYSTVWRWLTNLGHSYDKHQKATIQMDMNMKM